MDVLKLEGPPLSLRFSLPLSLSLFTSLTPSSSLSISRSTVHLHLSVCNSVSVVFFLYVCIYLLLPFHFFRLFSLLLIYFSFLLVLSSHCITQFISPLFSFLPNFLIYLAFFLLRCLSSLHFPASIFSSSSFFLLTSALIPPWDKASVIFLDGRFWSQFTERGRERKKEMMESKGKMGR